MRLLLFSLIITCLFVIACNRRDCGCAPPFETYYLKATVVQIHNLDCGKPLLVFEDTAAIHQITHSVSDKVVVDQLTANLNIAGQKLWVLLHVLKPEEEFFCTAMGPSFPHLKLVDAKARE